MPPSRAVQERVRSFRVESPQQRLDAFLSSRLSSPLSSLEPGPSRSQLGRYIRQGLVTVNGGDAKASQRLKAGDLVVLTIPPPLPVGLEPQWMPLAVVHQDDSLVVIDKPPGLSVHPGPGHPDRTLVNGLLALCPDIGDLGGIGGEVRPGIVHRLDKDTSGLMMVAKSQEAHRDLSAQIKDRLVTKGYLALAAGALGEKEGVIDAPIGRDPRNRKRMAVTAGGREARTRYRVIEELHGWSTVELYLETGRTHQIRVHLAHLGHPLWGDRLYGRAGPAGSRHFLHAHHLGFRHPAIHERVEFRSELPGDLASVLDGLGGG